MALGQRTALRQRFLRGLARLARIARSARLSKRTSRRPRDHFHDGPDQRSSRRRHHGRRFSYSHQHHRGGDPMVIVRSRRGGWMVAELMMAISLLAVAMIPLAFSFRGEQKLARTHYHQVIAMEIVDGEMEFLQAGHWRNFPAGEQ